MARIPRIERQVTVSATPQPYDTGDAGGPGRALASLGRALSSFAADAAAAREDLDAFEASVALTRFKNEQDLKVIEHNREVEGDGRDHLDRYTQQYDTERQRLLDSLPNNAKVRQRAALLTENWRGNYRENVYRRQLDHLSVYKEQELTGLVSQSIAPLVNGDIETVDKGIRQVEAALTNTRGLSPAQQERIRRLAVGLMAERWLEQAGPDIREQAEKRIQTFQMAPLKDAFGDIDPGRYQGRQGPAIRGRLSAYSPQAGGSPMEGGYAAARPGPDGKAEVRTLDDVAAGRSGYLTIAGSPELEGRRYIIPKIDYIGPDGSQRTLRNVLAVVHDTGSAFKGAPEGRFDIPVARDVDDATMARNHRLWQKAGVEFIPQGGPPSAPPMAVASLPAEVRSKPAADISRWLASSAPGAVHAVMDQSQRTFNAQGYGERTTGSITVNGRTYEFVNGGSRRGSIPPGEYQIGRYTSGAQRAREGFQYRQDAFELSNVRDDAPGVAGGERVGLLIHAAGARGVTAGCIGIKGDFEQFKRDLQAELARNGGKLSLNLMPHPGGGGGAPVRVAEAGTSAVDSSSAQPAAPRLLPSESLFAQWLLHNKDVIDKAAEKKQLEVYAAAKLDAWMSGREPFNAYADQDRKLVDEYFDKYTLVGKRMFDGDPGAVAAAVAAAQRLNYVPRAVEEAIQGLVAARDEAKQVLGLEAAGSILARNPNAFDKVEGGAEVKKNASLFSVLTGERGKTPQEALAHMKEIDSFEWKKQAEAREKEAKRIVEKELSESDITGAFDDNFLPFTAPSMPGLPGVRDVLFGTYKDLVRENYIRYGDDKVAKALAIRSLRQTWGVSEVTGTKQIMRYPPEHWYRQIGGDGHKWLKDQLAEDVERETGKKRDTVELRADSLTQRQIARGESPTYEVLFKADDGTWQRLPGRWIPDIDKAVKAFAETFEKERALKAKPLPEQLQERPIFRPLPEDTPRYAPERLLREGFTSFWESLKKKPPKESPPLSGMP